MCGITGFLSDDRLSPEATRLVLQRMTEAIRHRGPDADGFWQSTDGRVNLGHRRLSILDLSLTGAQPMFSPDGRHVLIFNGEIYNFSELREELRAQGVKFRGTSDTEVLLQALTCWGVAAALPRLNGMFAFAYCDAQERKLWLARDRFGEKPLFYGRSNGVFLFGSELKSLMQHPSFRREVNPRVLASYLRFNYVPWPHCIFKGLYKLPPGHCLEVTFDGDFSAPKPYWRLQDIVENRRIETRAPTDPALIDELDAILSRAVQQRMIADVPLGAFLSGGVDSSTVVALMQKQSSRPVKTFTIGFWETSYDEAEAASKVARHLGTEHHEYYLSPRECRDVITRLSEIYDEPFADSSQIAMTLVAQFTRRHVSVALSGDAGDEMFGGYNRYAWTRRIWPLLSPIPPGLRHVGRDAVRLLSPAQWDRLFAGFNLLLPRKLQVRGAGEKLHKLASAMGARDTDELYRSFVSQWQEPGMVSSTPEMASLLDDPKACPPELDFTEKMMFLDQLTYMPSDILCKVDRATMAASLEARVPFLDNEVARFAWSLPLETKLHRGISKWPLRQVLKRYVPEPLFARPKMGFGVPIGDWLRGPLREWAEDSLSERRLNEGGFFKTDVIRMRWAEHMAGTRNNQHALWGVLVFQDWYQRYGR